jgi:DNA polymerase-3 subunit epsilon
VRHGRLAGSAVAPLGVHPRQVLAGLLDTAEVVAPGHGPTPAASAEETECVLRWLERPGIRLVELQGVWASPAYGAGGVRFWADAAEDARTALSGGFAKRCDLRPVHQPGAAVSRIAG